MPGPNTRSSTKSTIQQGSGSKRLDIVNRPNFIPRPARERRGIRTVLRWAGSSLQSPEVERPQTGVLEGTNAAVSCAFDATLPSIARRARYAPCTPHTAHYTRTAPQVDIIQSSTNGYAHHGMAHALGHATTPWQGPPNAPSSVQSSG